MENIFYLTDQSATKLHNLQYFFLNSGIKKLINLMTMKINKKYIIFC